MGNDKSSQKNTILFLNLLMMVKDCKKFAFIEPV